MRNWAGLVEAGLIAPWTVIGYRRDGRPIYLQAGGAPRDGEILVGDDDDPDDDPRSRGSHDPDDDDDDDEPESLDDPEDDDTEDLDDDTEEESAEWTPPTQAEYEETQRRLRRASGEAASRKRFLRANGIDPKTGERVVPEVDADAGGDGGQPTEPGETGEPGEPGEKKASPQQAVVRRAEERGAARVMARLMPVLAANAVETALRRANWKGNNLDLVMRMIDLDDVDVEDGKVIGVDEQVELVQAEFPDWFDVPKKATKATTRRTAADVDGGRKQTQPQERKRSWVDQLDNRWSGASNRQR